MESDPNAHDFSSQAMLGQRGWWPGTLSPAVLGHFLHVIIIAATVLLHAPM
jgi:hypothetical protein